MEGEEVESLFNQDKGPLMVQLALEVVLDESEVVIDELIIKL